MQHKAMHLVVFFVLATASPSLAITPSDDLIIPGAARTRLWVDDLYINNPGDSTVSVEVFWLERGQANPNPVSRTFDIGPGATHIVQDVIGGDFGMNRGNGAFRITSVGGPVVANLIAVAVIEDEHGTRTLGAGFEGIPSSAATSAGESECPLIFQWGLGLDAVSVEDFTNGVEFTDTYPDGGDITWTVSFAIDDNLGFSGTLSAVGANFTGVDKGCNGAFPPLFFEGGKGR